MSHVCGEVVAVEAYQLAQSIILASLLLELTASFDAEYGKAKKVLG